jgi:hypothetical protein
MNGPWQRQLTRAGHLAGGRGVEVALDDDGLRKAGDGNDSVDLIGERCRQHLQRQHVCERQRRVREHGCLEQRWRQREQRLEPHPRRLDRGAAGGDSANGSGSGKKGRK